MLINEQYIKSIILSQTNFQLLPRQENYRCIYNGNLNLSNSGVKKLPHNLIITGNFYCSNNELIELPRGLIVKGEFNCYKNKLDKLPYGLYVGKDLYCFDNRLKEIPKSIIVNGTIFCYDNEMDIFRIEEKNTKIISYNKPKNHYSKPITVIPIKDEQSEEEKLKELKKEQEKAEEERLLQEKLDGMSEKHRDIYIRLSNIKKKRQYTTYNRYNYYDF